MSEKPIIFSTPMVRAILDGRKMQTRRVVKRQLPIIADTTDRDLYNWLEGKGALKCRERSPCLGNAPYKPGDILWVRETWDNDCKYNEHPYRYKADYLEGTVRSWKPSTQMPRSAARLFLEVKAVRAERLQDISEEDAKAEGAEAVNPLELPQIPNSLIEPGGMYGKGQINFHSYRAGFYRLWDTLNAKRGYGWDKNPWVWVIEFEKINREVCNE